jgi:hypothetical protein
MVKEIAAPRRLDCVGVSFDDKRLIADAGLLLPATLVERLGLAELLAEKVDLGERAGAARPERKAMTLISAMLAGADSIDDCEMLRAGRTEALLGHRVMAPSTLGTFLRAFSFGHVRQLESAAAELLRRAWAAGAGPGEGRLVVDLDSFVGEVHGYQKQGAAYGYTHQRGYHPLLATTGQGGEVLGIRLRKGSANTQRGVGRFIDELLARIGRAGHEGEILIRADSGFWRAKTFERLEKDGIGYSIAVRAADARIAAAISEIPEGEWKKLEGYSEPGLAEIAETTYGGRRLVARRVRELSDQQQLLAGWRYHPFITNRAEAIEVVEACHRQHAVVELAIRDLKAGALAHFPSGDFSANSAWTQLAAIAHNLARWSQAIGLPGASPRMLETFQRRLLRIPGRLTRSARKLTLHLPARWPWQRAFVEALERIRELSPAV